MTWREEKRQEKRQGEGQGEGQGEEQGEGQGGEQGGEQGDGIHLYGIPCMGNTSAVRVERERVVYETVLVGAAMKGEGGRTVLLAAQMRCRM
jgi:hypothetical protein